MLQIRSSSLLHCTLCVCLILPVFLVVESAENVCEEEEDTCNLHGERPQVELPREWHSWKLQHSKSYSSYKEELERHVTWLSNKQYIDSHNKYNATFGYTLAMNRLGDLNDVEYHRQYGCIDHSDNGSAPLLYYSPAAQDVSHLPATVDWHTKGAVSPVKDQGDCCASYAFSAAGTLEGIEALASGELKPLSEQNIIDCSVLYGNHGCRKGSVDRALEYIVDEGINTAAVYPYRGRRRRCHYKSHQWSATLRSYQRIRRGKEKDLQCAVATVGPIAAGIDASHNTFRFYSSGVYSQPICSSHKLNHAVVIVGYSTDEHGKDYWLVKNSWGVLWGERGFIRMSRNTHNQCGIATRALFPTL